MGGSIASILVVGMGSPKAKPLGNLAFWNLCCARTLKIVKISIERRNEEPKHGGEGMVLRWVIGFWAWRALLLGTLLLGLVAVPGCDIESDPSAEAVANGTAGPSGTVSGSGAFPGRLVSAPNAATANNNTPSAVGYSAGGYSATPATGNNQVPGQVSGQLVSSRPSDIRPVGLPARSPQTILIASFNIQAFGEKKVTNPKTAQRLASIIGMFDVVAIQEVRATDQTVLPQLLKYINANGARYDYILGPRLGRTVSKEQYAYIYDSTRLLSSPEASYTVDDKADLLHREPLVARFLTRVPQGYRPFSFSLMDIHTDPGEVKQELPVMHTVLKAVREYEWATAGEDDVLLMGDLNAAPSKFGPLGQMPGIYWIIRDQPTNTRRTEIYDNMLFDRDLTNEFTGRAGVLDVMDLFKINTDEALQLSDHMPIWAEFTVTEQPSSGNGSTANQLPAGTPWR